MSAFAILPPRQCTALIAAFALSGLLAHLAPARAQNANVHCSAPMRSDWLSWLEIESRIKTKGMRLVRLRVSDEQCLNVLAIDGYGQYMALLMHPVSGEVLRERSQVDPNSNRSVPWRIRKEP